MLRNWFPSDSMIDGGFRAGGRGIAEGDGWA